MSDIKSDKMDMSLDDIISLNRKGGGSGRGGGRGRGGSRGGGGGGGRFRRGRGDGQGGGQFQRRRSDDYGGGIASGGVQRRRDGVSSGAPYSRPRQVPDVWKHDLYEDSDRQVSKPVTSVSRNYQRTGEKRVAKLVISNLDFGVNDQDIEELFGEFGKLKHFAVHYDKSGRSLGTADVEYERMDEALKAFKQYNNVPLDGKPMKIEMEGDRTNQSNDFSDRPRSMSSRLGQASSQNNGNASTYISNSGPRRRPPFEGRRNQGQGGRGQGQRSGQRGRGRGGRGGRDRESVPSKEDLDAELDAYNAKMETE